MYRKNYGGNYNFYLVAPVKNEPRRFRGNALSYAVVIALTIKRRLSISNIIMLVLPIILTLVMSESASQGYLVVFPDSVSIPNHSDPWDDNYLVSLFAVIVLIAIVYLTNLTLTRRIFRSIMSPIEILVNGVRHIRDGDLTYRIEYQNNDEFDAVCSDFNEMATRLLDMVNQRQKDEQNQIELIAGISHDLRTPLTSIKSYAKGLRDGVAHSKGKENAYLDIRSCIQYPQKVRYFLCFRAKWQFPVNGANTAIAR